MMPWINGITDLHHSNYFWDEKYLFLLKFFSKQRKKSSTCENGQPPHKNESEKGIYFI